MAPGRTLRSLLSRRRRTGNEGEDEDASVMLEDSQSDGSAHSDDAQDDAGDASSLDATSVANACREESAQVHSDSAVHRPKAAKKTRKPRKKLAKKGKETTAAAGLDQSQTQAGFAATADTDAMMNGLHVDGQSQVRDVMEFDSLETDNAAVAASNAQVLSGSAADATTAPVETGRDGQEREHEEYKAKRESKPSFIPRRGNFFMHDTRQMGGRGRGRGGVGFAAPSGIPPQSGQVENVAQQPWKHDLHDAVNPSNAGPPQSAAALATLPSDQEGSARSLQQSQQQQPQLQQGAPSTAISFSRTTVVGKVQIRICLPGMKTPSTVPEVPWKNYIRLPEHRPPLRRDKPVRVALPGMNHRYIFPSTGRSFIFIPRQMRPNQQPFHRGYQRSIGGHGYSSRRTSAYGGSVYSGSRRSSLAGLRDNAFSPVGSFVGAPQTNRPVVRLPVGPQQFPAYNNPPGGQPGQLTSPGAPQVHTYALPQQPTFQGTPTTTVHQPRPQKAISVNDIESPAILQQPTSEPQPFQNQLPSHMHEQQTYGQQTAPAQQYFSPRQAYSYPQPARNGTPLSGIPEQAVHAASFQPPPSLPYGQPSFPTQYAPQPQFYYSPPGPNGYPPMPMYMHPQGYMLPPPVPHQAPQQPPLQRPIEESQSQHQRGQSQSGMVAHESNGMVFYMPASEAQSSDNYQPAEGFVPSYAMPGLPPTPAPDTSMSYYYPPMPSTAMPDGGTAMYYPAPQQ